MEYIKIGVIVNTHGLKGEVKVKAQTHFADVRFAKGATMYRKLGDELIKLTVRSAREHKGMMLVGFEGYDDINQVEAWKGAQLLIKEEQLEELDEDEIYYRDLMRMQVQSSDGTVLGQVVEIIETGANVVIRIQGEKELLLPYVKRFIKEVDLEAGVLIVELLDGML